MRNSSFLAFKERYFNILEHSPRADPVTLNTSNSRLTHYALPQRSLAGPTGSSVKKGLLKSYSLAFLPKEFITSYKFKCCF